MSKFWYHMLILKPCNSDLIHQITVEPWESKFWIKLKKKVYTIQMKAICKIILQKYSLLLTSFILIWYNEILKDKKCRNMHENVKPKENILETIS